MTSDTSHHMEGGVHGEHDDLFTKYQEIDRFRVILASIYAAPKSGTAREVYEKLRSLLQDDAKALKQANVFTKVEVTMSAASLLRHILECDDCKGEKDVCLKLEEQKPKELTLFSFETELLDDAEDIKRVGEIALKSSIPAQRDSGNN